MKKLKVASPKWAGYTGPLGNVAFKDGVSVDYLPRVVRDRLAASMEFVEIDEDGNEQPAGVAHRLVEDSNLRAPILDPLERQTEDDKKREAIRSALASNASLSIQTRAELEDIASKGGIKALRDVAEKWAVKHRSIPVLIELILVEQEKWLAARNKRLADAAAAEVARINGTSSTDETPAIEPAKPEPETADVGEPDQGDLLAGLKGADLAAASGDLSAALNDGAGSDVGGEVPVAQEAPAGEETPAEQEAPTQETAPAEGEKDPNDTSPDDAKSDQPAAEETGAPAGDAE